MKLRLRIATWLLGYNPETRINELKLKFAASIPIPKEVMSALDLTRRLYADHSTLAQSGEWKRHQVLAKLLKAGVNESDAGLSIELIHRENKD